MKPRKMRFRLPAGTLACAALLGLAGCGGGGNGGVDDAPVPEAKAASLAELEASSIPSANKATLTWTDWVGTETGFRIDKLVNNAWTPVATLPATSGGSQAGRHTGWTGTLDAAPTAYRVMALLPDGKEIALKTHSGAAQLKLGLQVDPKATAIILSMAEPAKGDVKLSVSGAATGTLSTRFYLGETPAPTAAAVSLQPVSTTGPSFETTWPTASKANGFQKVRAWMEVEPGSFLEIERSVSVLN